MTYIDFFFYCLITSLQLTAIHVVLKVDGMIFKGLGNLLTAKLHPIIAMPLFDCLICMGGIWSMAKGHFEFGSDYVSILSSMVCIIGINALLTTQISKLYEIWE